MNIFFWLVLVVVVVGEMENENPTQSMDLCPSISVFHSLSLSALFWFAIAIKACHYIPYPLRSSFLFLYANGADSFFRIEITRCLRSIKDQLGHSRELTPTQGLAISVEGLLLLSKTDLRLRIGLVLDMRCYPRCGSQFANLSLSTGNEDQQVHRTSWFCADASYCESEWNRGSSMFRSFIPLINWAELIFPVGVTADSNSRALFPSFGSFLFFGQTYNSKISKRTKQCSWQEGKKRTTCVDKSAWCTLLRFYPPYIALCSYQYRFFSECKAPTYNSSWGVVQWRRNGWDPTFIIIFYRHLVLLA